MKTNYLRLAQKIAQDIAYSRTPQLNAEIWAVVTGVMQTTIQDMARRHDITKQAVSKRILSTRKYLELL